MFMKNISALDQTIIFLNVFMTQFVLTRVQILMSFVRVTPPSPLRTAYCLILTLRTAYCLILTLRTAYRLTKENKEKMIVI